ncbi:MAG: hypothetical protein COC01_06465 [Bacteroidetes bacterium]|nr:MAG: hypothetical protein COC01_06465 [Bacteroidota bacterium]
MRKLSLIFFVILLVTKVGFADQSKVDSLRADYRNAEHDTTRINILLYWGEAIYLTYPDSALILWTKARDISDKYLTGNSEFSELELMMLKKGKANALVNMGYIYGQQGNPQLQLEFTLNAAKIFENLLTENLEVSTFLSRALGIKKGLAEAYNNIGFIYNNQGEIDKALEYFFLSLKIQEEIKDKRGMAMSYNNIGFIYSNQGEIEKALEYFFLSLKLREEIKDKEGMAYSYNNIGLTYDNQGEIDKALEYYFLSLKLREEIKDKRGVAQSYHNIGSVLCKLDSMEKGMRYLELGLGLAKELEHKARISDDYSMIGSWQLKSGQAELALESGLEALAVAKEIGHVEYMKRAARLLSGIYRKLGNAP